MFPLFRVSGRKNYTIEAFSMLCNVSILLSPRQVQQLLWSRCINTRGKPGKNIPMDLHMEHLNRACKNAISGLGANKTPKSIGRIAKCIGVLTSVCDNFDDQTEISQNKGFHTVTKDKKDRDVVLKELQTHAIFKVSLAVVIHHSDTKVSYSDMTEWMKEHIPS